MIGMKDAREKAIASARKFDAFCKENGIEDATALQEGGEKAQFKAQFDALYAEFQADDKSYEDAAKQELEAGKVPGVRERLSMYTEAVSGRKMGYHPLPDAMQPRSPGEEFVNSESYKALKASGAIDNDFSKQAFRSDPVVSSRRFAASDEISTASGSGAEALVTPFYLPGVLPLPQRPLTVRELFTNSPMGQGDTISYARQTGFDSAAAAVAQAAAGGNPSGAKPQSSIAWQRETAVVTTIATWMAATRQALADADQIRSLIDNQGRLMIQIEEEDQLLSGDGVSPNLEGIQSVPTVQTFDASGEDSLNAIRHTKTMVRTGASRLVADSIVVHPDDSEAIDLLKDLNGQYRGGNPIGNFTFNQPIWSLRRVESEGVTAGTAIVGAFRAGATVFERQPLTVYTSDSHSDFFVKNLIAVLFEERIAFPVFFPTAFVVLTLGTDIGVASGDEGIVSD